MRRTVYRSLDKSNSIFGMRGKYITYALKGVGLGLILSLLFSIMTNGILGIFLFLFCVIVTYAAVLYTQARYSERELDRMLSSKEIPDYIDFLPMRFGRILREVQEDEDD